jgi:uncharacterized protein (TIGR00661 family)
MKFLFVVQGEGRGHLTQAITLREMLIRNGHEVVAVLVGKSNRRDLPDFFSRGIHAAVYRFDSPNFLPASKSKRTNIWASIAYNFLKTGSYLRSIYFIRCKIKKLDVDVVINFYELLTGLTYVFFPPKVPYVSVAHQYLFLHPDYSFPHDNKAELEMLKFFTKVTCFKASKLFALSINPMDSVPADHLVVVPPLLRREILTTRVTQGDYLHGYMLNDNYADEIIDFQAKYPDVQMHFFWDRRGVQEEEVMNSTLTFHRLNDKKFIRYMAGCKAYATTAGFESVCEAMYMGKPVLMVPTHIEQACNAHEASLAGAGIVADHFDLIALLNTIPEYKQNARFREWVEKAETCWMKALTFQNACETMKCTP